MGEILVDGSFIIKLIEIILINIVLSGDNAVVIALACRRLPQNQQRRAVFWGSFGAIALRIILTFAAVWLLQIPFLKIIGSLLLLWIAITLLIDENDSDKLKSGDSMIDAIKTIIIADLIMSLDNVVAVAGSANGNILLIILGLSISIPLIIWGSQMLMLLMRRYPIIVTIGAALLGYTAGEMLMSDKSIDQWMVELGSIGEYGIPILFAIIVVLLGKFLNHRDEINHKENNSANQQTKKKQLRENKGHL